MTGFRTKLAFCLDVICAISRHPQLIPMLAKLAVTRVALIVCRWWTGTTFDDLRREMHRRKRIQLLTGRD